MLNYQTLTQDQYVDSLIAFLTAEGIEGYKSNVYPDKDGMATIGYGYTFNRNNNVELWQAANIQLTSLQLALLQQIDAAPDSQKTQLGLTFGRINGVRDNYQRIS